MGRSWRLTRIERQGQLPTFGERTGTGQQNVTQTPFRRTDVDVPSKLGPHTVYKYRMGGWNPPLPLIAMHFLEANDPTPACSEPAANEDPVVIGFRNQESSQPGEHVIWDDSGMTSSVLSEMSRLLALAEETRASEITFRVTGNMKAREEAGEFTMQETAEPGGSSGLKIVQRELGYKKGDRFRIENGRGRQVLFSM
ncbi:hypothetical protein SODALDRAFT_354052 [Sodiomyces alkalinus F11]|uniref:Uncharacterized protein n=1 Tax=Sodiomyces alkalinus (strain CBS 110278 / VKM F-3762 / F11) TaxID=1314773 RepID=A0A3N2Q575_SODAK|nr:hypothetical protein SODALDRAFT_354052 [Sodiomyces alkalinus F11]ROT41929.1 hypothetical protein SODALDRAFT_354052 [Sodiomyces alkalinus F11]